MLRILAIFALGLSVAGCVTASTPEPASEANFTARDKEQLAKAQYQKAILPEPYRRHIVDYHRQEAPGSIVVDSDARYLYFVLPDDKNGRKKAVRYGIAVGEEALAFSGVAKVGRLAEWPSWTPTQNIKNRLEGIPNFVPGGVNNPLGARGIYLYANGKDTLFRVHGTNQPEMIGSAVSSGCIRMTNEDIIDLYNRVKLNAIVVVLAPKQGDSQQPAGRARHERAGPLRAGQRKRIERRLRAPFLFSAAATGPRPPWAHPRGADAAAAPRAPDRAPPTGTAGSRRAARRDRGGHAPRDSRPIRGRARW
jgi:lipoprotein-anchoring transpeptidase ErfK/SrfK